MMMIVMIVKVVKVVRVIVMIEMIVSYLPSVGELKHGLRLLPEGVLEDDDGVLAGGAFWKHNSLNSANIHH